MSRFGSDGDVSLRPGVSVEFVATNLKAFGSIPETLELQLTGFGGLRFVGSAIDADELVVSFTVSQIVRVPE
jgi:hypothetical protein